MRVVYVIDSLAPGGAETSLAEMAPHLSARGIDLHVVPLKPDMALADRLRRAGTTVHPSPQRQSRLARIVHVRRVVRDLRPDLIHTTLYEANVAGRLTAWVTGFPVSTSLVGDTYGAASLRSVSRIKLSQARLLDKATARLVGRFHAVSQTLAAAAVRHLAVPRSRIDVIPRGRDPERFPFRSARVRSATRRALGIAETRPVILTVGRLEPAKGLIELIDAMPTVLSSRPDSLVLIAGKDGRASSQLHEAAAGLPVDSVRFLGHSPDVSQLLTAADVLCFPSLSEGSPGTLIEAMAVGCPIVASRISPNIEVLGDGEQAIGTLVPVHDSPALASALLTVLAAPDENDLGSGRTRFESFYQIDIVADRMTRFFTTAARQS